MLDARGVLLSLSVVLLYSIGWMVSKNAVNSFPPILLSTLRLGVAALILVWFVKPPWHQLRQIMLVSVLVAIGFHGMVYTGLRYLDVSMTVVLSQLNAPILVLIGIVFLQERASYRKVGGTALAFLGTFIVMGSPNLSGQHGPALLVVGGVFIWSVGQIIVRSMRDVGAFTQVIWISVFAAPQLLLMSAIFETDHVRFIQQADWDVWITILCLGLVVTPVGVGIWYGLVRRYPFSSIAPFLLLTPTVSMAGGVVFFGEELTLHFLVGASLVLLGIGSILIERRVGSVTVGHKMPVA